MLKLAMVRHLKSHPETLYVGDRPEDRCPKCRHPILSTGTNSINRYSSNFSYQGRSVTILKTVVSPSPQAKAIGYIREVSRDA